MLLSYHNPPINNKFRTKKGDLTVYSFVCGYVQWASLTGKEIDHWENGKRMYYEGSVYQVQHFKDGQRIEWESFDRIGDARKFYNRIRIN